MGAYRFIDNETTDAAGIIRTADGAIITNDDAIDEAERSLAWADYLVWKAVPNTPDAALASPVADSRTVRKAEVDAEAMVEVMKDLLLASGQGPLVGLLLGCYEEARRWERKVWASIHVTGNATTQALAIDTYESVEPWDTNGDVSDNAVADQANDKVTTGKRGVYRLTGGVDVEFNTAVDAYIRITVGGSPVAGTERRVRAPNTGEVVHLQTELPFEISSDDQDVQLEIKSSGLSTATIRNAVLAIEKVAELDTAANYPFLDELAPNMAADRDAVAEALVTEHNAIKVRIGQVEDERREAHKDIDAAADHTAVVAVSPTWPA